ncbi:hypothetical protein [Nostoc sp.]|uniref:hypothetical protein n=1 Tax=Nostoc sp. TaxID=1180 RepID=UPI002FF6B4E3
MQDHLYRFMVAQGQKLYFDQLVKGGSMDSEAIPGDCFALLAMTGEIFLTLRKIA